MSNRFRVEAVKARNSRGRWTRIPSIRWGAIVVLSAVLITSLSTTALGVLGSPVAVAAEWHVAVDGQATNRGTRESPWDLTSALDGRQKVQPGDTIWITGGTYRHPDRLLASQGFVVRLAGTADAPIQVRAVPGTRATLDGGMSVVSPTDYVWIRGLEILVSENFTLGRELSEPGSHPQSYGRPWGGLNISAGRGCKYINLVIHDNAQGVSFWRGATDSELYGCIIYDNGWKAPDRGHGHAIYTQNEIGTKTIADCIMTGGYGYTLHAYGSERAFVDHYLIVGNIAYNAGTFLIGGGRPSRDIRVYDNILYSVTMQLGYSAPENEDCEVIGNTIVNGGLAINRFRQVRQERNIIVPKGGKPPSDQPQVFVRRNRYDEKRAHLAVVNWSKQEQVEIPWDGIAQPGDRYRLFDPRHIYDQPIREGTVSGTRLEVPLTGEFAAWVLMVEKP